MPEPLQVGFAPLRVEALAVDRSAATRAESGEGMSATPVPGVDLETLREAIQEEYTAVALRAATGLPLPIRGVPWPPSSSMRTRGSRGVPEAAIESFAGTGNPLPDGRSEGR